MEEVQRIFTENEIEREEILASLTTTPKDSENCLDVSLLDSNCIFHIQDIQKICVTYRLRFLDSHFFKGEFPQEAISKIRRLEKDHNTKLTSFKIVAPAKLLKLENADDPLLFTPLGNEYFYLIHKWGNDLHPLRKILMWPYKSFENIVFTVFVLSLLITFITPIDLFTKTYRIQEFLLLFLFIFKGLAGMVLFYGFAKGKNFNSAIWDSKYYNG
jgi:hypothetical protein